MIVLNVEIRIGGEGRSAPNLGNTRINKCMPESLSHEVDTDN